MKTIGETIRELREDKGLTQQQLGELSGMSHIAIHYIESGKHQPTVKTISRIAVALNVSYSILYDLSQIKNK